MVVSRKERLKKELGSAIDSGDLELALAVTQDMVDLMGDDPESYTSKAVILAKLDRYEEAVDAIDEALEIDKEDPKAWYSKGCILMDSGRPRPALACFYKSLDLDPSQERARNRFQRCLDQMVRAREMETSPELYHDGPSLVREDTEGRPIFEADFSEQEEEEEEEEAVDLPEEPPSFPKRRRKGSLLDEDLFDEEEEDEEWDLDEDEEFDEWEEDEEEEFEEEEDLEPVGTITCRCGGEIPIYSDDRPYRFECPDCGRTGTLK